VGFACLISLFWFIFLLNCPIFQKTAKNYLFWSVENWIKKQQFFRKPFVFKHLAPPTKGCPFVPHFSQKYNRVATFLDWLFRPVLPVYLPKASGCVCTKCCYCFIAVVSVSCPNCLACGMEPLSSMLTSMANRLPVRFVIVAVIVLPWKYGFWIKNCRNDNEQAL